MQKQTHTMHMKILCIFCIRFVVCNALNIYCIVIIFSLQSTGCFSVSKLAFFHELIFKQNISVKEIFHLVYATQSFFAHKFVHCVFILANDATWLRCNMDFKCSPQTDVNQHHFHINTIMNACLINFKSR